MKKGVWNKKAQEEPMLLRNVLEILIAIAVVILIVYGIVTFSKGFFGKHEEMQAKGQLDGIIQALAKTNEFGKTEKVLLQAPSGWHVVAFDIEHNENEGFEKPNTFFGKHCVCICEKKCKTEICRQIEMPLKQAGKVAEQALIEIEIQDVWFKNMKSFYNVTEKELIEMTELSEEKKEEVIIGNSEIEKKYGTLIAKTAQKYHAEIKEHFISATDFENFIEALIWKESSGKANAISPCGAMGLMQLMPDTARDQGLKVSEYKEICHKERNPCSDEYKNCYYAFECNKITKENCKPEDERYDAEKNIDAGTAYLVKLIKQFNNKQLALAAYNAGPGNVRKYCQNNIQSCHPAFEGRKYAEDVMAYYSQLA